MKKRQKRAMRTLFGWICTVSGILVMLAQLSVIFSLEKMHAAHLLPLVICAGFIWLGLRLFRLNDLELMTDASRQNDPKKAAKIIRQLEKVTDEKYLHELVYHAERDDVFSAAIDRYVNVSGQKAAADFAASSYYSIPRCLTALKYVSDQELLQYIAHNAHHGEMALHSVEKITDQGILRGIAEDKDCHVEARVEALDRLGENLRGDVICVPNARFEKIVRRNAASELIASGDSALIEECAEQILSKVPDDIGKDFIADAAAKYPDIFRKLWQRLCSWTHIDKTDHTDYTPKPNHADSVQYYDYYKTPSGLTFANKSGRQKHTDTTLPSSDCADYGHTDSTTHQDKDDESFLSRLPAAIKE